MSTKEQGTLGECREHCAAARREAKATLKSLLPEAFWEHAHASRREAKAACAAFRRAAKRQILGAPAEKPAAKQKIEIA